jgi:hypothetical protein
MTQATVPNGREETQQLYLNVTDNNRVRVRKPPVPPKERTTPKLSKLRCCQAQSLGRGKHGSSASQTPTFNFKRVTMTCTYATQHRDTGVLKIKPNHGSLQCCSPPSASTTAEHLWKKSRSDQEMNVSRLTEEVCRVHPDYGTLMRWRNVWEYRVYWETVIKKYKLREDL